MTSQFTELYGRQTYVAQPPQQPYGLQPPAIAYGGRSYQPALSTPQAPLYLEATEAEDEEDEDKDDEEGEETIPGDGQFPLNTAASTFEPGRRRHPDFLRRHMEAEGRLGPGNDRKKPEMYKRGGEAERLRREKKLQEQFKKPEEKKRTRKDEDDDLWDRG